MITALIKRLARYLDENKIPYMTIGGQAVLLYGTPRLTRDIDITLGVVDLEDVRHILARSGEHIDLAYIRRWLSEFSSLPEHERIGEDFEGLLEG